MTGAAAPGATTPEPVTFLGRPVPASVARSHYVLDGTVPLVCDRGWHDVFAVVEDGEIDLETPAGGMLRLIEGDSLSFALIGPVVLRAVGRRAVLAAVTRRPPSACPTGRPPDPTRHEHRSAP
jgi:hypothetical protein